MKSQNFISRSTERKLKTPKMVKSKSSKMHLEINNDLELDIKGASTTKRNRKSKKSTSSPINKKVSFSMKTPKRMASKPKMMAKKKSPSKRKIAKKGYALKSKPLMPSILINGKRVPVKAMKMSSEPKMKETALFSRREASTSRRKASASRRVSDSRRKASVSRRRGSGSRRRASDTRRKASASRRKASASRRRASDSRRRASASRRRASDARRKASASRRRASDARRRASDARRRAFDVSRRASDARRKASDARRKASDTMRHSMKSNALMKSSMTKRDALASSSKRKIPQVESRNPRFSLKINAVKMSPGGKKKLRSIQKEFSLKSRASDAKGKITPKGSTGAEKSQTIYMPIQQDNDGKTAEAIVVNNANDKKARKVDVTDVKIAKE